MAIVGFGYYKFRMHGKGVEVISKVLMTFTLTYVVCFPTTGNHYHYLDIPLLRSILRGKPIKHCTEIVTLLHEKCGTK